MPQVYGWQVVIFQATHNIQEMMICFKEDYFPY